MNTSVEISMKTTLTRTVDGAPVPTVKFSKAESLRRLRSLTKMMRAAGELPFGASFEISRRVYVKTFAEHPGIGVESPANESPDDDDLYDVGDYDYMLGNYGLHEGEVTEIWIHGWDPFDGPQLVNTVTVWMGTADADPDVIS
jgi:hypothetical protein